MTRNHRCHVYFRPSSSINLENISTAASSIDSKDDVVIKINDILRSMLDTNSLNTLLLLSKLALFDLHSKTKFCFYAAKHNQ